MSTELTKQKEAFSIKEILSFGFEKTKKYWLTLLLVGIIQILVQSPDTIMSFYEKTHSLSPDFFSTLLTLTTTILAWVLSFNTIRIYLKIVNNHDANLSDLFKFDEIFKNRIVKYVLTLLAVGAITVLGLILLIIPGLYFAIKLCFAPTLVIEKGFGVEEALKKSWEMTNGQILNMAKYGLVSLLLTLAGLIVFIVGVIPVSMVTTIGYYYIYKKLSHSI